MHKSWQFIVWGENRWQNSKIYTADLAGQSSYNSDKNGGCCFHEKSSNIEKKSNWEEGELFVTERIHLMCLTKTKSFGTFQNANGDMIGIDQSTVSRAIDRVTNALFELWPRFIRMPTQRQTIPQKVKFFAISLNLRSGTFFTLINNLYFQLL